VVDVDLDFLGWGVVFRFQEARDHDRFEGFERCDAFSEAPRDWDGGLCVASKGDLGGEGGGVLGQGRGDQWVVENASLEEFMGLVYQIPC